MDTTISEGKIFKNRKISGEETKNSIFESCSFLSCDFSNGVFTSVRFVDCVFTSCNLSMAKLNNCQLNNSSFKECKLLGVNFSDCNDSLFSVKFEGCVLDYCSFTRKKMLKTMFRKNSMKSVDFTECDLTKSVFSDTDLLSSVFNKTVLKEVDFTSAINYNIDPEQNNIRKAKFSLQGVAGLLRRYDISIE